MHADFIADALLRDQTSLAQELGALRLGTHACLLYQQLDELLAVTAPFLRIGLERNERCVFLADPQTLAHLEQALRDEGVDVERERQRGALSLTADRHYLTGDLFVPETMTDYLSLAIDEALAHGFTGLRVTGDVVWQLGPKPDIDLVAGYEAMLDAFFHGRPFVGLCQYRRQDHSPELIRDMLRSHEAVGLGLQLVPHNPFHEPPQLVLEQDCRAAETARVDWMTATLLETVEAGRKRDQAVREQVRQALSLEIKDRLAGVLEGMSDAFLALDRDWRITYANREALRIADRGQEEVIGKYLWELQPVGPEDDAVVREFRRADERMSIRLEHRQIANGEERWLDINVYPSPAGLNLFFRDITARKQAEQRIRESERHFRAVADLVPDLLWRNDPQGRVTWFNRRWTDYTGQTCEASLGDGWLDAIHPDDRETTYAHFHQLLKTGQTLTREHRIRGCDGAYRWFLVKAEPVRDDSGRITQWFGAATDIQEQRAALEALRESEEHLRNTVELNPQIPWTADAHGALTSISSRTTAQTGLSPEAILGDGWKEVIHPDDLPEMDAAWRESVATGKPYDVESRLRMADGSYRWWRNRAFPSRDAAGAIVAWYGATEDIDDRKRAEEHQLLLMNEVDHRAKNALAVAQNIVMLTRADSMPEFVAAVEGRVAALARVHTLLAKGKWTGADLRTIICEELQPYLQDSPDRLHLDGQPLTVAPDAVQPVGMVLHELATNAVKYGALSVPAGIVQVAWRFQDDGRVCLTWREMGGPPVSAPTRSGFGSRMIAATVKGQLDGAAKFDWQPDGLRCTISLAADQILSARADRGRDAGPENTPAPRQVSLAGRRVLLVEDDALLTMGMQEALESFGCEAVGPAATLEEALRLAAAEPLDLAVLDVNLRGREAWTVADILTVRGVPYLFATGYGGVGAKAAERGVPVLVKPFAPDRLAPALRQLLVGTTGQAASTRGSWPRSTELPS